MERIWRKDGRRKVNVSDAIDRIKAILEEATEGENAVCYVTDYDAEPLKMAISALEKQDELAADVVEVVRCRDCRYFYNGSMRCCTNHFGVVLTDENGFCHHAKRREDEGVTLDG